MKCIRPKTGPVKRVSDQEAFELVQSGKAQYVPKNVWKKEVRDAS